jgi:hypothetical protein
MRTGSDDSSAWGTKPSGRLLPRTISRAFPATFRAIRVVSSSGMSSATWRWTATSSRSSSPASSASSSLRRNSVPASDRLGNSTARPASVSDSSAARAGTGSVSGRRFQTNIPVTVWRPAGARTWGEESSPSSPPPVVATAARPSTFTSSGHCAAPPGNGIGPSA